MEYDPGEILESPSAERNKKPIQELVLSPIVYPRLFHDILTSSNNNNNKKEDTTTTTSNTNNDNDRVIRVLELAAGCGVHTTYFVSCFLNSQSCNANAGADITLEWHPSDPDNEARSSIDARTLQYMQDNLTLYILPANSWALGKVGGTSCQDGGHRDKGDAGASKAEAGQMGMCKSEYATSHTEYFDLVTCINMIHIAPWEACLGLMECAGIVLRHGGLLLCYGPYFVNGTGSEGNIKFNVSLQNQNSEWGVRNLEDVIDVAKQYGLEFVQSIYMPANNLSVLFCKK